MITRTTDVAWLDWLADQAAAKVEVDMEGNIIVSPSTNPHALAASMLIRYVNLALPPGLLVVPEGPRWSPLGLSGPSYVPDFSVVEHHVMYEQADDYSLDPPPLLIAEIVSPESRRRDRIEKAEAYYTGGAQAYWTVEVPRLTGVASVELTVRERGEQGWDTRGPLTGVVELAIPFPVGFDLATLAAPV